MNLGGILGQNLFEDHPWQAVPDLPHPLASLWSHPGLNSMDKLTVVQTNFLQNLSLSFVRFGVLDEIDSLFVHIWFEDHSWQAVPDLPRPLASLWSNPGQISAAKQYKCLSMELYNLL